MIPELLFTLESDSDPHSVSSYQMPNDKSIVIWAKVRSFPFEIGSVKDTSNLIDILQETLDQLEQE